MMDDISENMDETEDRKDETLYGWNNKSFYGTMQVGGAVNNFSLVRRYNHNDNSSRATRNQEDFDLKLPSK